MVLFVLLSALSSVLLRELFKSTAESITGFALGYAVEGIQGPHQGNRPLDRLCGARSGLGSCSA